MIEHRQTREETEEFLNLYPLNRTSRPELHDSIERYTGEGNLVRTFDSLPEMAEFWIKKTNRALPWGGIYNPKIEKQCLYGDEKLVKDADALLEQLEASAESIGPSWEPDVMGGVLSVPRYLASDPQVFYRKREIVSDKSPLRIVLGISVSGGSVSNFYKRGIAILALAMKLQAVRPVEVLLFEEGYLNEKSDYLYCIKLDNPVSLAHAVVAMAVPDTAIQLLYGTAQWEANRVRWPHNYRSTEYNNWREYALGLGPNDLFFDSAYYGDGILENPVEWINKHLKLYTEENEETESHDSRH